MKQINVYFEDEDFEKLNNSKGSLSWKNFILDMYGRCELDMLSNKFKKSKGDK